MKSLIALLFAFGPHYATAPGGGSSSPTQDADRLRRERKEAAEAKRRKLKEQGFEEQPAELPAVDWNTVRAVEGKVVGRDTFVTEDRSRELLLLDINGVVHKLFDASGLRDFFRRAKVGDEVKIACVGSRPTNFGNAARVFKVWVKPAPYDAALHAKAAPGRAGTIEDMEDDIPF